MNIVLCFFLLCSSAYAANESADSNFRKLWKNPTAKNLQIFKRSCTVESQPNFDGGTAGALLIKGAKKVSLNQIRALFYALAHCSDGSSAERLSSALGTEILLARTAFFVEAVFLEKPENIGLLLHSSVSDWEGVECETDQCRTKEQAYFASKTRAIKEVKLKKPLESTRQEILLSSWGRGK